MKVSLKPLAWVLIGITSVMLLTMATATVIAYFLAQKREQIEAKIDSGVANVLEGLTLAVRTDGIRYDPYEDILTFRVKPENIDMSRAKLEFYRGENRVRSYLAAVQAYSQKSFAVSVQGILSGLYRLKLTDIPNATGFYIERYEIPERLPILKVTLSSEPVAATVGDSYPYPISVENLGVVPAKNIEMSIYARNQQLQFTDPPFSIVAENDKSVLTIPHIPPKSKLTITLQLLAHGHEPQLYFDTYIVDRNLAHPDQKFKNSGRVIGSITPKAVEAR